MDKATQERFRKSLHELAVGLRPTRQQEAQTAPVLLDGSIGRLTRMEALQSQQMALALKRRQQEQLQRVERALRAIDDGTYGTCGRCEEPIAEQRLEAQPDAVLCLTCAAKPAR